ncbi:hypothetical protein BSKO_12507 [Bryopsis sp. KO-2023]|nr:hypothetical protein BSKO_12507 [Bryopsis sp. KO-2023]
MVWGAIRRPSTSPKTEIKRQEFEAATFEAWREVRSRHRIEIWRLWKIFKALLRGWGFVLTTQSSATLSFRQKMTASFTVIRDNLKEDTCCALFDQLLGVANRGLQARFTKYIHDNITTISAKKGFLELSVNAIQHLLGSSLTTFDFCLALAGWLGHDPKSRQVIAGSLLSDLDLFSLEVDELKTFGALKAIEGLESVQRDIQQQLVEEVDAIQRGEVTVLMQMSKAMATLRQEDIQVEGKGYVCSEAINVWKVVDGKGDGRVSIWNCKKKPTSEAFNEWLA